MADRSDETERKDHPSAPQGRVAASGAALRRDLDEGKGRDKVTYPDPAAAPLGTDDEAAGTPITEEQLQLARAQEDRRADVPQTDKSRVAGATGAISVTGAGRHDPLSDEAGSETSVHPGRFGGIVIAVLLTMALLVLLFIFSPV